MEIQKNKFEEKLKEKIKFDESQGKLDDVNEALMIESNGKMFATFMDYSKLPEGTKFKKLKR